MEMPQVCQKCNEGFNGPMYKSSSTHEVYHLECLQRQDFPNRLSYFVHKKIGYFTAGSGMIIVGGVLGAGASWHYFPKWGWKGLGIVIPTIFLSCVAFQFFCPDQRER